MQDKTQADAIEPNYFNIFLKIKKKCHIFVVRLVEKANWNKCFPEYIHLFVRDHISHVPTSNDTYLCSSFFSAFETFTRKHTHTNIRQWLSLQYAVRCVRLYMFYFEVAVIFYLVKL